MMLTTFMESPTIICIVASLAICLCLAVTNDAQAIQKYTCHRASSPIVIDGKLDDAAWEKAEVIKFVLPITAKTPLSKTEARILWDDDYLYVGYQAYDKDIWSILKERDSSTCTEDVLECFFQPNTNDGYYYNFEINALGTIYDARNSIVKNAGGYDYHRWAAWNCEGARVGIQIDGTLNDPSDIDHSWRMELAVPFAELPSLKGKIPVVGDVWKFLLARYDYSVYLPDGVELSSISNRMKEVNFHKIDQWAQFTFAE